MLPASRRKRDDSVVRERRDDFVVPKLGRRRDDFVVRELGRWTR